MGQFKKSKNDVVVIGLGHSMILSHMPSKVPEADYSKVNMGYKGVESFGLFSSPDYNTFYPGVSQEDFIPKDEDFIEPVYRLLSEVIVNKEWNPIDFSIGGVLKASAPKLVGQTVNCDHSTDIANAIGSVKQTYWQESFKDKGIVVPAGINGVLKLDAKANPRIARGILMNPPSVHSNSVSIQFSWDKSHPKMDDNDFWSKIGTYDEHGQLIRKVCTHVQSYRETSLVSHGADPFAQKINEDGTINNPRYAGAQSYSEKTPSVDYFFFDWKETTTNKLTGVNNTMVFNMKEDIEPINPKKQNNMNEQELLALLVGTGMLTLEEGKPVNKENVILAIKGLVSNEATLTETNKTLNGKVTTLEAEVVTLKGQISGNESLIELGKNHLSSTRTNTISLYKKVTGEGKEDENIINLINGANLVQLESLSKGYQEKLDAMFPMACSECGSKKVTRGSASTEEGDDKGKGETENRSFGDILDNIAAKKNQSSLFKKDK